MKSWLRFFGLSFFSDKIAKEARKRGVLNCVLGFVLSLLFIFCGVLAANCVPFYTHYKNAPEFRNFIYGFVNEVPLTVKDGLISANGRVNTFSDEEDAAKYAQNGYNLVIDTRPSDALDDFEAYCLSKDGKTEITYESYLGLTDAEKADYGFKIRYTPNELKLTAEKVAEYESFLSASEDDTVKKQYGQLAEDRINLSTEEYDKRVYALWAHAYYPKLTDYESAGEVPLLRTYYYREYLYRDDIAKSLFVFDDVMFGIFNAKSGMEVTFYGSYGKLADGAVTADGADGFIKGAFSSSTGLSANVYLLSIFRFIPFIAIIPLVLALIAKLALTLMKDEKYKKYTTCLKIEFSYLAVGSLVTALIVFISGFFLSSGTLNALPLIIFAAVLAVRTAVLILGEYLNLKKENAAKAAEAETEKNTEIETNE